MKKYFVRLLKKIEVNLEFGDYQIVFTPRRNHYKPRFQFIPFYNDHLGYPYIYIAAGHFMFTNSIF